MMGTAFSPISNHVIQKVTPLDIISRGPTVVHAGLVGGKFTIGYGKAYLKNPPTLL